MAKKKRIVPPKRKKVSKKQKFDNGGYVIPSSGKKRYADGRLSDNQQDALGIAGVTASAFIDSQIAKDQAKRDEKFLKAQEERGFTGSAQLASLKEAERLEAIRKEGFEDTLAKPGQAAVSGGVKAATTVGTATGFNPYATGAAFLVGAGAGLIGAKKQNEADLKAEKERAKAAKKAIESKKLAIAKANEDIEGFGYKLGGIVKGPGTQTSDSIPMRLKQGSFVVPAKNAKKVKEVLNVPAVKGTAKSSKEGIDVRVSKDELIVPPGIANKNKELLNASAPNAKHKLETGAPLKDGTKSDEPLRIKAGETRESLSKKLAKANLENNDEARDQIFDLLKAMRFKGHSTVPAEWAITGNLTQDKIAKQNIRTTLSDARIKPSATAKKKISEVEAGRARRQAKAAGEGRREEPVSPEVKAFQAKKPPKFQDKEPPRQGGKQPPDKKAPTTEQRMKGARKALDVAKAREGDPFFESGKIDALQNIVQREEAAYLAEETEKFVGKIDKAISELEKKKNASNDPTEIREINHQIQGLKDDQNAAVSNAQSELSEDLALIGAGTLTETMFPIMSRIARATGIASIITEGTTADKINNLNNIRKATGEKEEFKSYLPDAKQEIKKDIARTEKAVPAAKTTTTPGTGVAPKAPTKKPPIGDPVAMKLQPGLQAPTRAEVLAQKGELKEFDETEDEYLARKREEERKVRPDSKRFDPLGVVDALSAFQATAGYAALAKEGKLPEQQESQELQQLADEAEDLKAPEPYSIEEELKDNRRRERRLKELAVEGGGGSTGGTFSKQAIASGLAQQEEARLRQEKKRIDEERKQKFQFDKLALRSATTKDVLADKRRIFEDRLLAHKENRAAFANLMQTGIANFVGNQELKEARRREAQRNDTNSAKTAEMFAAMSNMWAKGAKHD